MGNENTRAALAKVEGLLAMVVGVQKMSHMTMPEFLAHAHGEIAKASEEPVEKSRIRLSLLYKSVMYASATIEDAESDAIKVPVFVCDQTTFGEQANELHTPSQSAGMNPSKGTFEGGLQKFIDGFGAQIEAMKAAAGKVGENDEETDTQGKRKATKPPSPEEEEKTEKSLPDSAFLYCSAAKGKDGKPADRKFPFKGADGKVDPEKLRAAEKAITKSDLPEEMKEKLREKARRMLDAEKKIGKGLASGEVAWPDDMNDAAVAKNGHENEPDWGLDGRPL